MEILTFIVVLFVANCLFENDRHISNQFRQKPVLLFFLTFSLFTNCNVRECDSVVSTIDNEISGLYIYDSLSTEGNPSDSLVLNTNSIEKSLMLYNNTDSLCKTVDGLIHLSIFKLNNQKFAIAVDSTTKVFKQNNGCWEKLYQMPISIGLGYIKSEKIDVNQDGFKDILIQIPSGGSYGDDYICLFFNPVSKKLEYDSEAELRNVELNLEKHQIKSNYSMSSRVYEIDKYSFRYIQQTIYLGKTVGEGKLTGMCEVTNFDKSGSVVKVDTLQCE